MIWKTAHLSSVHPAVDTRIGVKECRTLAAAGYDVVFVCPHSSADVVNGVRIAPVRVRRNRLFRILVTVWDVFRAALRERAHVYHLHDAELLPAGLLLRITGAKVIYDVHEDLPRQILAKPWLPHLVRAPLARVTEAGEGLLARGMNGIIAATPRIARRFRQDRTITVQNYAMIDELAVEHPTPYAKRDAVFVYIGGIAAIRGAFEMVAAVALVPQAFGARLVLAGLLNHESLRARLERTSGWQNTQYHGWQTREQVARHLDSARAGLLLIHPTQNYLESYPLKAFEYMASGLPLIVSDFPLWRGLFEEVQCAIFVNPLDPGAIARAMTWILENPEEAERMGERGRTAARSRFNWQPEAAKLLSFYDTLVKQANLSMVTAQLGDA